MMLRRCSHSTPSLTVYTNLRPRTARIYCTCTKVIILCLFQHLDHKFVQSRSRVLRTASGSPKYWMRECLSMLARAVLGWGSGHYLTGSSSLYRTLVPASVWYIGCDIWDGRKASSIRFSAVQYRSGVNTLKPESPMRFMTASYFGETLTNRRLADFGIFL